MSLTLPLFSSSVQEKKENFVVFCTSLCCCLPLPHDQYGSTLDQNCQAGKTLKSSHMTLKVQSMALVTIKRSFIQGPRTSSPLLIKSESTARAWLTSSMDAGEITCSLQLLQPCHSWPQLLASLLLSIDSLSLTSHQRAPFSLSGCSQFLPATMRKA